MAKKINTRPQSALSKMSVALMGVAMVVASIVIVGVNRANRDAIRSNIITTEEQHQEEHTNSLVATFNQAKDTLSVNRPAGSITSLYERMLIANVKYLRYGDHSRVLLLGDGNKVLFSTSDNPEQTIISKTESCLALAKTATEDGRCVDPNGGDPIYYHWHRIPSLGSKVEGQSYLLLTGFLESDALKDFNKVERITMLSLLIQSVLLVFALFVSLWAVSMKNYYHKKTLNYESRS